MDVGCGKTELLLRAVARYGCAGFRVDTNAAFLDEARRNAGARGLDALVTLRHMDAAAVSICSSRSAETSDALPVTKLNKPMVSPRG